jgi:hypothetical protein
MSLELHARYAEGISASRMAATATLRPIGQHIGGKREIK